MKYPVFTEDLTKIDTKVEHGFYTISFKIDKMNYTMPFGFHIDRHEAMLQIEAMYYKTIAQLNNLI